MVINGSLFGVSPVDIDNDHTVRESLGFPVQKTIRLEKLLFSSKFSSHCFRSANLLYFLIVHHHGSIWDCVHFISSITIKSLDTDSKVISACPY